jgi:hypothetical protein
MSIGDRRHAAQLKLPGERKARFFDDPGCALVWLDGRGEPWNDVEIWVRDPSGEHWIDARQTRYRSGATTPMGYGFAAAGAAGELSLEAVAEQLESLERERRDSRH